jgi:uncharacterized protein YxeA
LIQYAPHNLLTYSEQFDNTAWTKGNATVSANVTTAPDGTTTADKLVENTAAGSHSTLEGYSFATTTYTYSVYAKAGERTKVRFVAATGSGGVLVDVNLITGSVSASSAFGTGFAVVGATVTSIGTGWYRAGLIFSSTAGSGSVQAILLDASGNNSYTGDGVSGIYIWGAQLNEGALQPYYSTTVKNLLGYSQNFENAAWTKSNSSIAASTVIGPFGFDGGEKLVENTVNILHYVAQTQSTSANSVLTLSVYAKAGERTQVDVRVGGVGWATSPVCVVNLITGAIVSGSGATVVPVGDGWFRISLTAIADGTTQARGIVVAPAVAGNSTYTGDGTSGIYIFGAQLSDSASLDPYSYNPVAAPTSTAYYGPRFDYDPVTLAPKGLLIEEQRTNLLTYSSEFDNAAWLKLASTTVTANTVTSPDGAVNADTIALAGAAQGIYQTATVTASTVYTASVYVKLGTMSVSEYKIAIYNATAGAFIATDITPTAVVSSSGWTRIDYTFTTPVGCLSVRFYPIRNSASVNGTVYLYGAQLEAGAFSTSYIPTTSATVTRAADNANMVGSNFSSWYNQSGGTIFANWDTVGTDVGAAFSINDTTNNNAIQIYYNSNYAQYQVLTSSINQVQLLIVSPIVIKSAATYTLNNFAVSFNGASPLTDTAGTIPNVTQLRLGSIASGGAYLNGHIQSIKYYPTRLPNADLQRLTR